MAQLEITRRIYARPTIYTPFISRVIDANEYPDIEGVFTSTVYGENFDYVTGFYLSAESIKNPELYSIIDAFSSYEDHISSLYPEFSGYPLSFEIINENTALINFSELSSFNNPTLIALNPAGYYPKDIYSDYDL